MLIALRLLAHYEHQRAGTSLLLENVQHAKLPGYPGTDVGRRQKLPVAAAVESVAVERQRHLEVPFLAGAKVPDRRRDIFPGGQWRTQQATETAALGVVGVDIQRVKIFDGIGHVVCHLSANGKTVALRRGFLPDEGGDFFGYQSAGHLVVLLFEPKSVDDRRIG